MGKVNRETAEADVNAWLDKKKIFESEREQRKEFIEILVESVMNGVLVIGDDGVMKHALLFPFGDEEKISSLTYKLRLNDKMLKPYLKGVTQGDGDERMLAYIAALTEQPRGLIANLDTADKKTAMAIAIFFL